LRSLCANTTTVLYCASRPRENCVADMAFEALTNRQIAASRSMKGYALLRSNLKSHSDADVAKSVDCAKRIKSASA
jgi:hypothetical protein